MTGGSWAAIGSLVAPAVATGWTHTALLNMLGYGLLAGVMATGCAFVYRRATIRPIPVGVGILVGVTFPALLLVIEGAIRQEFVDPAPLDGYGSGIYVLGVFAASVIAAGGGRWVGDHLACGVFGITRLEARGEVARLVRSAGLTVSLTLPTTIDDAEGYPPVDDEIKRELSGRTVSFPRRLSIDELRTRLGRRLERDYDVGHVHVEFADDGAVEYLALGRRPSGLSPTLPPETVAVAVRGDPSAAASSGDPVEIWTTADDRSRLVATGRLRSSTGDVTTVLVDADAAAAFETGVTYRLTTRPDSPNDGHELVSLIRISDETIDARTVDADHPLEGEFVDWAPGTVLVVERDDERIPFPDGNETVRDGDTVHAFGTPEQLRAFDEGDGERERDEPTMEA